MIEVHRAGPRVAGFATRERDLKEALPFDRQVERTSRRAQVAGAEVARGRDDTRAESGVVFIMIVFQSTYSDSFESPSSFWIIL